MTVTYTAEVATAKNFGCFFKLLLRWRGSIYKLVWCDLLIFLFLFFCISTIYRLGLNDEQRIVFEKISAYCEKYGTLIPVSFVLGFYVTIVIGRWWQQYMSIPWIDGLAIWVNATVQGDDEKDRLLRRTLVRYACLSMTQTFTLVSPRVKQRFPTLQHFVEAGLLLENEKEIIIEIDKEVATGAQYGTNWVPLLWCASLVSKARSKNKIKSDVSLKAVIDQINGIKGNCGMLVSYDWISVPLVYTQVVTLAEYAYFFSCLMGKQFILADEFDAYLPIFTILQFLFYMGWLKVAETLANPFGDDDDDYELNWIVDRNIQVGYLIVDGMHSRTPDLFKDQHWDEVIPSELPYTPQTDKDQPPICSTDQMFKNTRKESFDEDSKIVKSPDSEALLSIDSLSPKKDYDSKNSNVEISIGEVEESHQSKTDILTMQSKPLL